MSILRVALDVPLDTLFDYSSEDISPDDVGRRVLVPFGRKQRVGVVMDVVSRSAIAPGKLKAVLHVLRETPPVPGDVLALLRFCGGYYHHPIGEVVIGALPVALRRARPLARRDPQEYRLTSAGRLADEAALNTREKAARKLLTGFKQAGRLDRTAAIQVTGSAPKILKRFLALGWIEAAPEPASAVVASEAARAAGSGPTLNAAQREAVETVLREMPGFTPWVIHGVTGSGKTEVYLQLIARVLGQGGQALVLVPEINLTPQLETRFRERFPGARLVVQHSGLGGSERARDWLLAQQGQAQIVIGTRLAVFTPLPDLTLVIVDEEHDPSYKQQDGLRYSARDVAVARAKQAGIPIVLGSATPSLETLYNARSGRYRLLTLPDRAGTSSLPEVRLVDTRIHKPVDGLSVPLLEALRERLGRGEQSLVFINRRGYAPVLACSACDWVSECSRCASRLVVHLRDGRLRCHHCGHEEPPPRACPECGNQDLKPLGHGTQRVESALAAALPGARILRIDRDSTRRRDAWAGMRNDIELGRVDVLVGTQILAKGHDFPGLSLVGIVNPDAALFSGDFRASERLAAQLLQVAGRAGRARAPGTVLIQTRFPAHPLYQALCRHDFDGLAEALLAERKQAGLPPFAFQALLRAEGTTVRPIMEFLEKAERLARKPGAPVTVYEPVPAAMPRLAGKERAQLLVEAASRNKLQAFLSAWYPALTALNERRVRWAIDVDPLEI
ncbi:MAG: primosomal protein N' [Betaproteobacteria bacterium]|nr:primosomal protein N' [Betaproteobacteria bacterium]